MNKVFIFVFIILFVIYCNVYWYFKQEMHMIVPYETFETSCDNIMELINKKTPFYQKNMQIMRFTWKYGQIPNTLDYTLSEKYAMFNILNYNALNEQIYSYFNFDDFIPNNLIINYDIIYNKKDCELNETNVLKTYNYINLFYCLKGKCKLHIHEPVHNSNLSLVSQIQCIKYFDSFFTIVVDKVPIKVKTINIEPNMLVCLPFGCVYSFEFDNECLILSGYHTTLLNKLLNNIKQNNDYIIHRR